MTESKICCVCKKEGNIPYKCPNCREPYCSLNCYKSHKEVPCTTKVNISTGDKPENNEQVYQFPTEDTVPFAKLEQLKTSPDIKTCLSNPHVRDTLKAIVSSKRPTEAIALAMAEPIFVELVDACLKVIEPQDENHVC